MRSQMPVRPELEHCGEKSDARRQAILYPPTFESLPRCDNVDPGIAGLERRSDRLCPNLKNKNSTPISKQRFP